MNRQHPKQLSELLDALDQDEMRLLDKAVTLVQSASSSKPDVERRRLIITECLMLSRAFLDFMHQKRDMPKSWTLPNWQPSDEYLEMAKQAGFDVQP